MLRHLGMMEKAIEIENALLYTLESGVHTGDFGDKSIPSVNTTDFANAIIANFGKQPKNNARPGVENFEFHPQDLDQKENVMLAKSKSTNHKIVGVDFFIESIEQPSAIANLAKNHESAMLQLVTITNRGTQVWPTGSVFTNLVNQYGIRFETIGDAPLSQSAIAELYLAMSKDFTISSLEVLNMWGDKKAYSLAQGQ
jgi:isocitrate dehydrogenase